MHRYLKAHVSNHDNEKHGGGVGTSHNNTTATRSRLAEGERLNKMVAIEVVQSEKRKSRYLRDPYIVYLVESRPFASAMEHKHTIWRRYSEFEILRNYLSTMYPCVVVPPLPEKRTNLARLKIPLDKFDPVFVERRRERLSRFLSKLAAHPAISEDEVFRGFFRENSDVWREVAATRWKQKFETTMKLITQTVGMVAVDKVGDERFEMMRLYSRSLDDNIATVLKIQQRVSNKMAAIMRQHLEWGKLFRLWLPFEKGKEGLGNRLGNTLEQLADDTGRLLEEEETSYVGPLREYSSYVDSIHSVVWNQHSFKQKLLDDEKSIADKRKEREELRADIEVLERGGLVPTTMPSGMQSLRRSVRAKLLGPESLDVKQERMLTLEEEIKKNDWGADGRVRRTKLFEDATVEEFQRFEERKCEEINEMCQVFARNQLNFNKTGLTHWKLMREYFTAL